MLGHPLDPARPPARQHRAEVGFVFQEFALVERATVRQNVLNGRLGRTGPFASLFGRFTPADHAAAEAAMEETGIAELAEKRADQLSGGQRQRVAISRCLAQDPQLILADEPVSNLDPVRAEAVLRLLAATAERRGATLVFSSHQPALATRFARRVIALRDGRIAFDGAPSALTAEELAAIYEDVYEGGVPAAASLRLADERAVAYVPARSVLGCPLAEPPRRRRDSLGRRDDRCRAGTAGRCRRPHRRVPRAHGAARPLRHAGGRQGHGRDPQDRRPRHARLHHGLARAGGRSRPRR